MESAHLYERVVFVQLIKIRLEAQEKLLKEEGKGTEGTSEGMGEPARIWQCEIFESLPNYKKMLQLHVFNLF